MSAAQEKKQEADFTKEVDELLPQTEQLAKSGKIQEALEKIMALEKKSRNAADLASTTRLLVSSIQLIRNIPNPNSCDWKLLNETIFSLARKHGQLKQAVTKMVQEAMTFLEPGAEGLTDERKMTLVETIRTVTEGKIFVEVERARATRMLSEMLYAQGDVNKAADVLQELAVETFGSMERREKTEFILEQMRLNLERGDYARMAIVAKKINTKFFDDEKNHDLKLRYYDFMIRYGLHERKHLDVCKYHREIYSTPSIRGDEARAADVLRNVVVFLVLSPYDNEQSDLMARVEQTDGLDKVVEHKNLLKCFTTPELMRWPGIESLYGPLLRSTPIFAAGGEGDGDARWEELHKRVVEHNIRVVANYYTRITLARLSQLLDLPISETESSLAALVTSGTIYAKIDRPAGIVNFEARRTNTDMLNAWSGDVGKLLDLVEKTTHLINKEQAVHRAGITIKSNE